MRNVSGQNINQYSNSYKAMNRSPPPTFPAEETRPPPMRSARQNCSGSRRLTGDWISDHRFFFLFLSFFSISTGGRVLNVVGTGPDLQAARAVAYQAARRIRMRGGWFRRDIAAEAATRPAPSPA